MTLSMFISHSHNDNDWCDDFVDELKRKDIDVWYDREDRYSGAQWSEMIEQELQRRDVYLIVVTPDSWTSQWVQHELQLALEQRKRIVGVLCKPTQVGESLSASQLLDARYRSPIDAAQLVAATLTGTSSSRLDPSPRRREVLEAERDEIDAILPTPPGSPPTTSDAPGGSQVLAGEIYFAEPSTSGSSYPSPLGTLPLPSAKKEAAAPAAPAAPSPPRPQPSPREQVAFTSHYPREVELQVWDRLLVFIALDTEKAAAQVEALAEERLQHRRDGYRAATTSKAASLRRKTRLTIVPELAGFRLDPASITTEWIDDVQCYDFRLRAEDSSFGRAVNGRIAILEGPVLRGEIPLSIFVRGVRQPPLGTDHMVKAHVSGYRNTFASYSHKDEQVVRAYEAIAESTGDRFLRDVRTLRAGEEWDPKLLKLIDQADVFQLFWSKHAAESRAVEREWRHALELLPSRANFVRPVYWTPQPWPIPPELQLIHLGHLYPNDLGLVHSSWLSRILRRGR